MIRYTTCALLIAAWFLYQEDVVRTWKQTSAGNWPVALSQGLRYIAYR